MLGLGDVGNEVLHLLKLPLGLFLFLNQVVTDLSLECLLTLQDQLPHKVVDLRELSPVLLCLHLHFTNVPADIILDELQSFFSFLGTVHLLIE